MDDIIEEEGQYFKKVLVDLEELIADQERVIKAIDDQKLTLETQRLSAVERKTQLEQLRS